MFSWLKQKVKQEHELNDKDIELTEEIKNHFRKIFLKELKRIIILKKQV